MMESRRGDFPLQVKFVIQLSHPTKKRNERASLSNVASMVPTDSTIHVRTSRYVIMYRPTKMKRWGHVAYTGEMRNAQQ
jgi:hypothetical protein